MSNSDSHPALHETGIHTDDPADPRHFAPVGWEETDRAICPCGEAVRWDDAIERWVPDRTLVVFVLEANEAHIVREAVEGLEAGDAISRDQNSDLVGELTLQAALNAPWVAEATA